MRLSPVASATLTEADERTKFALAAERGSNLRSLVAAAIAIGRMPGEPAVVLTARQRPHLLSIIFGRRAWVPLADPRLEVIRAISASLSRGIDAIRADLIADAVKAGWSRSDLSVLFPALSLRAES
jgi:hypothetical protein